ncbi:MAG: DedA family protein [Acidobacteriota bacterium]|nr:DedA family protein [Acidobacteriota bacterium]
MFEWIANTIERLGYWGIAGLTLLENIVPPIPSEVVVPMAGFVAATGGLSFWGVVAAATVGALAGAAAWYVAARSIGAKRLRRWVDDHGHWVTLTCGDIDKSEQWFEKHGPWAVFLGRLVPGVRTFISVPAGFSGMPAAPFLISSAIGTIIWTLALAWAGTVLQSNFDVVGKYIDRVTNVLLVAFLIYLAWRYVKVFRARAAR